MIDAQKPHVSEALRGLRRVVVVCAIVMGVSIAGQMLVWAFTHYTDIRYVNNEPTESRVEPVVVDSRRAAPAPRSLTGEAVAEAPRESAVVTADANRVPSRASVYLRTFSAGFVAAGVVSTIVFVFAMFQAVVVAAGGRVPGVEKAATAGAWGLVAALMIVPLRAALPSFPLEGVFISYEELARVVDARRAGEAAAMSGAVYYGSFVLVPLLSLGVLALAALRFHAGVEAGVIVTSVSELDEQLEREMARVKMVATNTPRSVGALNRAIGDRSADDEIDAEDDRPRGSRRGRRKREDDEPARRPI